MVYNDDTFDSSAFSLRPENNFENITYHKLSMKETGYSWVTSNGGYAEMNISAVIPNITMDVIDSIHSNYDAFIGACKTTGVPNLTSNFINVLNYGGKILVQVKGIGTGTSEVDAYLESNDLYIELNRTKQTS
jgi:hypothetical protein